MTETIIQNSGLSYLAFGGAFNEALHGFTLRQGGVSQAPYDSLNLGYHVGDNPHAVSENRRRLALALGYDPKRVTAGQQVHGTKVEIVTGLLCGSGAFDEAGSIPQADGLVTEDPRVVLMAHAADCTLIYLYDPVRRCVGLAHAGWRGALAGMGRDAVSAMGRLGCKRENIFAALSPSIGPCCYAVGEEVAGQVPPHWRGLVVQKRERLLYLDLPLLQQLVLKEAGIGAERVTRSSYCTCCNGDKFYSYRASGGRTGRMAGVISLSKQVKL